MLYRPALLRLLPGYRRLMRDGARARAVVLAAKPWWGVVGSVAVNCRLRLKVRFDDGTTTTIDRVARYRDLGDRSGVGSIVPVRHAGPAIELDLPEMRRVDQRRQSRRDRRAIRDAEKRLGG